MGQENTTNKAPSPPLLLKLDLLSHLLFSGCEIRLHPLPFLGPPFFIHLFSFWVNGYVKRFITAMAGPTQVWLGLFPLQAHSSLCLAPLAPWKRETWHKKVLLALPMKSAFFSRGTTLQLPNTQMMLYPPQHNPVLQSVYASVSVLIIMLFFKEEPVLGG